MNVTTQATEINLPAILAQNEPLTMSSREIADLVEARHDSVKRTIQRLSEKHTIGQPPLVDDPYIDAQGKERVIAVYHLEKRDSLVVVAQLSPEFTARIVDRWQELEEQATKPVTLSGPQLMAAALIEANETLKAQAVQIEDMRGDVEAHERLVKADGSVTITEAAKNLGLRPKDLFQWMQSNGWIYKRPGAQSWLGYQTRCNSGDLEHKTTTVLRADGSEKIHEQVRVTARGLDKLARLVPGIAHAII